MCPRLFDVQSGTARRVCKDEGRKELPLLCKIIATVPLESTHVHRGFILDGLCVQYFP